VLSSAQLCLAHPWLRDNVSDTQADVEVMVGRGVAEAHAPDDVAPSIETRLQKIEDLLQILVHEPWATTDVTPIAEPPGLEVPNCLDPMSRVFDVHRCPDSELASDRQQWSSLNPYVEPYVPKDAERDDVPEFSRAQVKKIIDQTVADTLHRLPQEFNITRGKCEDAHTLDECLRASPNDELAQAIRPKLELYDEVYRRESACGFCLQHCGVALGEHLLVCQACVWPTLFESEAEQDEIASSVDQDYVEDAKFFLEIEEWVAVAQSSMLNREQTLRTVLLDVRGVAGESVAERARR